MAEKARRYALVTGANKGIGFGVCEQLAKQGIVVILTARSEQRGKEAIRKLEERGLSHVLFHQLDVTDQHSVDALADFVKSQFGKLDILINNVGVSGLQPIDESSADKLKEMANLKRKGNVDWSSLIIGTPELTQQCVAINYMGTKRMCEAFIPLLLMSESGRIVNVSSSYGKLQRLCSEWAREVLGNKEGLTEKTIDEVVFKCLEDIKKDASPGLSAYNLSKVAVNVYTSILSKKHPSMCINSVCPGYVATDMNYSFGALTVEEGAENVVPFALLPEGGPSGCFFVKKELSDF